jgi:hypothetical protein
MGFLRLVALAQLLLQLLETFNLYLAGICPAAAAADGLPAPGGPGPAATAAGDRAAAVRGSGCGGGRQSSGAAPAVPQPRRRCEPSVHSDLN